MLNSALKFPEFPKILLIAGKEQNVGKTTLAGKIIAQFTWEQKITGLKITPHFHKNVADALVIEKTANYQILKEISPDNNKDTSIMLRSGAEEAYLLQVSRDYLIKGFTQILKYIPENNFVVCESAMLNEVICPGVLLALRRLNCKIRAIDDDKLFKEANRVVTFTVNGFDFSLGDLQITPNGWRLKSAR